MTYATDSTTNTIYGTSSSLTSFGTTKTSSTASTSSSSSSSSSSSTESASTSLNQTFDQYLTLLTTQLKNQDPLNPTDNTQMTQQLLQMSQAEQAIATNTKLDKLVELQQSNTLTNNLSYIGRVVQYEGTDFQYVNGMSSADLAYKLDSNATSVNVEIRDSSGNVVRTLKGDTGGGSKKEVAWDFKNDSGETVPEGTYSMKVVPKGQTSDDYIDYTSYTFAVVTGVDFDSSGNPVLRSGDTTTVKVADVVGVY